MLDDGARQGGADSRHFQQLLLGGRFDLCERPQRAQKGLLFGRPQAGHGVQRGPGHGLCPLFPVERDGESVRFVAQLLEKPQRGGTPWQDDGEILARNPHLLEPFRQADDADVSSRFLDDPLRRVDLRQPAVDDYEVRLVSESSGGARLPGDPRDVAAGLVLAGRCVLRVARPRRGVASFGNLPGFEGFLGFGNSFGLAGILSLAGHFGFAGGVRAIASVLVLGGADVVARRSREKPGKPAAQHLVHRGRVVRCALAVGPAHDEVPVVGLFCQTVLKDHH